MNDSRVIQFKVHTRSYKKNPPRASVGEKYTTTFCKLPTPGMCVYTYRCLWVGVNMCVCVCVYMCLCMCVYTCMSARVCVYVCVHVCVHISLSLCVCVCVHIKLTLMGNFTCRYFRDQSATKLNICKCPSKDLSIEDTGECFWKSRRNRHIIIRVCCIVCSVCVNGNVYDFTYLYRYIATCIHHVHALEHGYCMH